MVTIIEPGLVDTEINNHITDAIAKQRIEERRKSITPLQSEDIAVLSWLEHSRSGEGERLKGKGERSEDFFLFPLPLLLFPSERFLVSHSIENRYITAAIVYAVTQPQRVNVNEILIRPTEQQW